MSVSAFTRSEGERGRGERSNVRLSRRTVLVWSVCPVKDYPDVENVTDLDKKPRVSRILGQNCCCGVFHGETPGGDGEIRPPRSSPPTESQLIQNSAVL